MIKRDIYIIASFIQIIHKSFFLSLKLWDYIIEKIMHTWNKIITSFNQRNIILFKYVNDVQSNVFHLKTLSCRIYVYVSKIIIKHKLNDRSWKEILMNYEGSNQWNVYNFKMKRIHLSKNVWFDEKNNYYELNSTLSKYLKKEKKDEIEKDEIWTKKKD